jgi:hypothetical protein
MNSRFSKRDLLLLIGSLAVIGSACSEGLVAPSASVRGSSSAVFGVEPATRQPVFSPADRPAALCPNLFSTQFVLVLRTGDLGIRSFGFDFVDRLGTSIVPLVPVRSHEVGRASGAANILSHSNSRSGHQRGPAVSVPSLRDTPSGNALRQCQHGGSS